MSSRHLAFVLLVASDLFAALAAGASVGVQFPAGQVDILQPSIVPYSASDMVAALVGDQVAVLFSNVETDSAGHSGGHVRLLWLARDGHALGPTVDLGVGTGPLAIVGRAGVAAISYQTYNDDFSLRPAMFRWLSADGHLAPETRLWSSLRRATTSLPTLAFTEHARLLATFPAELLHCGSLACTSKTTLVARPYGPWRAAGPSHDTSEPFAGSSDDFGGVSGGPAASAIAGDGTGRFLVAWETPYRVDEHQFVDDYWEPIQTRLVSADGSPLGPIAALPGGYGARPLATALPAGQFAVAWGTRPDGPFDEEPTYELQLSRVDTSGQPAGPPLNLGPGEPGALAADGTGNVLLVSSGSWQSPSTFTGHLVPANSPPTTFSIASSRFEPSGVAPAVRLVALGERRFLAVWLAGSQTPSTLQLSSQLLDVVEQAPVAVEPGGVVVVSERGTTAELAIRLRQPPTAAVTIPLAIEGDGVASLSADLVEVGPLDWDQPHLVTVTGGDDGQFRGDRPLAVRIGPATSDDPVFAGASPGVVRLRVEEPPCHLQLRGPYIARRGRSVAVSWDHDGDGCGARVALELWQANAPVATVSAGTANDGHYRWAVPADLALGVYQLRLHTLGGIPAESALVVVVRAPRAP